MDRRGRVVHAAVSSTGGRQPHRAPQPGWGKWLGQQRPRRPGAGGSPSGEERGGRGGHEGPGPGLQCCGRRGLLRSLPGVSVFYWPLFQKRPGEQGGPWRGQHSNTGAGSGGWGAGHTSTGGLTTETSRENSPQITRKVKLISSGANCYVFITLIYYTLVTFVLCHINCMLKKRLWLTEGQLRLSAAQPFPRAWPRPLATLGPPSPCPAPGSWVFLGRREGGGRLGMRWQPGDVYKAMDSFQRPPRPPG